MRKRSALGLCEYVCVGGGSVHMCVYSLGNEFGVVVAGKREEALGTGVELGDDVGEGLGAYDRVLGEPVVLYRPTRQGQLTAQVLQVEKHSSEQESIPVGCVPPALKPYMFQFQWSPPDVTGGGGLPYLNKFEVITRGQ